MYINYNNEEIIYNSIDTNDFLSISMAGITNPNPNYHIIHNINRHFFYDYYVFEYVISGNGYIEFDDKKILVKEGDFYFLNKLCRHIYYSDKTNPFKKIFIVAKGSFIDSLIASFKITESVIIKKINAEQNIKNIHNLLIKNEIDYASISHEILNLFYLLGKELFLENKQTMQLPELIRKYIDTSVTQKLTLEKISSELNVSVSHIERVFKKTFDITPLNYFMKQKTKYACALLVNTTYPISIIAEQAGFCDSKYMAKCIKKETGLTPVEYRKSKTHTT
jgi:AraC-like DNA-binding protein